MLNSRSWSVGLGIVLVGGGFVLADTPVMRSILRRPAQQAPSESGNNVAEAPSERKFKGLSSPIVLPRGRSQAENPRDAIPQTVPDQPVDVPGLEVTFGGGEVSTLESGVNVPTPVVDDGEPGSPATRPIFDGPPVTLTPEVTVEGSVKENSQPANPREGNLQQQMPNQMPPQMMQPRMNQSPNPNQEPPGFLQRRRMRRAGASATPSPLSRPAGDNTRALATDSLDPSILDIEMPTDVVPAVESPAGIIAAKPVGLEIPVEGKKPLFSTR